jgi:hypothetical protein
MAPILISAKVSQDTFPRYGGGMVQAWCKHGTWHPCLTVSFLCTSPPFSCLFCHPKPHQIPVSFPYENFFPVPLLALARTPFPASLPGRLNVRRRTPFPATHLASVPTSIWGFQVGGLSLAWPISKSSAGRLRRSPGHGTGDKRISNRDLSSELVGFDDPNYLHVAFKREVGMNPGEYRLQHSNH